MCKNRANSSKNIKMTRIGLLSDTHGYLDDRIHAHLSACDEVWHAGDIGNEFTYDELNHKYTLRAVFGNIDGHELRVHLKEAELFYCEKTMVLMKHIGGYPERYEMDAYALIKKESPNLFISGHSHILKVMYDKKNKLLHLNPGAAGINGFHKIRTMLRFTIDKDNIKDLEVIEFGSR